MFKTPDFFSSLNISSVEAMCHNKDPHIITIMGYVGGYWGRQQFGMKGGLDLAQAYFRDRGIIIVYSELTNDLVKTLK